MLLEVAELVAELGGQALADEVVVALDEGDLTAPGIDVDVDQVVDDGRVEVQASSRPR